ncbi:MAG: glutamate--tRNA ligase family protein [Candidatus Puniceispirillaceae bacterium]
MFLVDDMIDGVTLVTRGMDLEDSTHVHRLLQAILEIPAPAYYHHDLVCDEDGQRLAKRHDAQSIKQLRAEGMSADDIVADLPPVAVSLPFSGNF